MSAVAQTVGRVFTGIATGGVSEVANLATGGDVVSGKGGALSGVTKGVGDLFTLGIPSLIEGATKGPNFPTVPTVSQTQPSSTSSTTTKRRRIASAGGTLLTSGSGLPEQPSTFKPSLLGGVAAKTGL